MTDAAPDQQERFAEELSRAAAGIDVVLEELVPRPAPATEWGSLADMFWYHVGTGGKRIRPAICLMTCRRLGGDPTRAVHFAAAVEILHNMLLVHDDVEDGDTVRRDQPTVWARYGVPNAVNLGDYMLGVAYRSVLRSPVDPAALCRLAGAFTEALETTCIGQGLDLAGRGRTDLTVDDYLHMVTLKTGRYLALGMVGGAIVAGMPDEAIAPIEALAESMGAAFQIRDDVIDLTLGKGRGGVVGNDIREGKPSILYAHALGVASGPDREDLLRVMSKPRELTTEEDVTRVVEIYALLGSLNFAQAEAERLVARAYEAIERIPVEDKEFFRQLTRYMVSRNK